MSAKIFQQIPKVMADIEAIEKSSENKQQGFKFRGIDAVYNEIHSHLTKHGVFTATEVLEFTREDRTTKNGGTMIYTVAKIRFRFYADDGSYFDSVMIGEAADFGDKSSNKAMSVAHKYAFIQVFSIPTEDEKDPDAQSHELAPRTNQVARGSIVPPKTAPNPDGPSDAQLKRLFAIANQFFWKQEDVKSYLRNVYKIDSSKKLTKAQYDEFCKIMETQAPYISESAPAPTEPGWDG